MSKKMVLADIEPKLKELKQLRVLPQAQANFRIERYIGAPEPGVAPYERVLYRYTLQAVAKQHQFRDLAHRLFTEPVENRSARFGRDEEFKTMDFITEILNSDVNTSWRQNVCHCEKCNTWLIAPEPIAIDAKGLVCFDCVQPEFNTIDEIMRRATLEEKAAMHKKFAEEKAEETGMTLETLLEYLVNCPQNAKRFLSALKPAKIERFTVELTTEKEVWPDWWQKTPKDFQEFCKACGTNPEQLYAGVLDQNAFKKARTEWHEKRGEKFIPNSPRLMGLLEAFGASEEVRAEFEKRGGHALVKASTVAKGGDKIYLSNEPEPLFNIGNWGRGHYSSCQTTIGAGDSTNPRSILNLEDPNTMVLWLGGPRLMRSRVLVRKLKIKATGELALGLDVFYGNTNADKKRMVEALRIWAEKQGITKIADINGGHRGDKKFDAVSVEPVKFSCDSKSYSDLGAWHPDEKEKGKVSYTVNFHGNMANW